MNKLSHNLGFNFTHCFIHNFQFRKIKFKKTTKDMIHPLNYHGYNHNKQLIKHKKKQLLAVTKKHLVSCEGCVMSFCNKIYI